MKIPDHRAWKAGDGRWLFTDVEFDTFVIHLTSDLHDERHRALLTFNYAHGATGGVQLARQSRAESFADFIDRVVEEHLNELDTQDDIDRVIGEYSM